MSLPFLSKKVIDLPPIVSVELIQITEKTNIPFAPKAKKIIEEVKKNEKNEIIEFNIKPSLNSWINDFVSYLELHTNLPSYVVYHSNLNVTEKFQLLSQIRLYYK